MLKRIIFKPVDWLISFVMFPVKIFLWMLYFLFFKHNDY